MQDDSKPNEWITQGPFYVTEATGMRRFKDQGTVWAVMYKDYEDLVIGCGGRESIALDICKNLNFLWDYTLEEQLRERLNNAS